jgi:phage terminase Nu1 subunit (DNA packaging protein)
MATPAPLPLLTRPQVAALLRANPLTVSRWEHEGLPVAEPGAPGRASRYDAAAVVAWYTARRVAALTTSGDGPALEPNAERARKDRAQAELAEQTLAVRRGALIPKTEFERVLGPAVTAIRAKLLALPRAAALRVVRAASGGGGEKAVERVLMADVRDTLTALAHLAGPARRRKGTA